MQPVSVRMILKSMSKKNVLEISGERKKSEKKYNVKESVSGKFTRKYGLPDEIKIDNITAEYIDGVLTIKLPKDTAKLKTKTIEIK
jgi:HSP20 family protein